MSSLSRKTPFILLFGDILAFVAGLWATLLVRYQSLPDQAVWMAHVSTFSYLFLIWIVVYFIAGLYERDAALFRSALPPIFISVQFVNLAVAVAYFYIAPVSTLAPKTNLFILFVISTLFVFIWRGGIFRNIRFAKREQAVLIGSGSEMRELAAEIDSNPHYHFSFSLIVDVETLDQATIARLSELKPALVVIDLYNDKARAVMPELYNLLMAQTSFIDMNQVYEGVFGRVALSILKHNWFLENISNRPRVMYDVFKRVLDFVLSIPVFVLACVVLPFVALIVKIEDGGPVFIKQERIGQGGKSIKVYKVRTMSRNDSASAQWGSESGNRVTAFGAFLRKASIDELPQVWNILKGELSFIGPRSDIAGLGTRLAEQIPYYNIRYLSKPGISGWAQVNQRYSPGNISPQSVEETKLRLAYDLYYVKNRSLVLDTTIVLRTIKTLISRTVK